MLLLELPVAVVADGPRCSSSGYAALAPYLSIDSWNAIGFSVGAVVASGAKEQQATEGREGGHGQDGAVSGRLTLERSLTAARITTVGAGTIYKQTERERGERSLCQWHQERSALRANGRRARKLNAACCCRYSKVTEKSYQIRLAKTKASATEAIVNKTEGKVLV